MEDLSEHPSVEDFDTLLAEMKEMDDRSIPMTELLNGEGPSESELMELVDRSRTLAESAERTSDTAVLRQIARVRVLANQLNIRALFLGMFRDGNDRGWDDDDRSPICPKHPHGVWNQIPVLAA